MPIERRTRAPAPSACSTARNAWRIARGTDMFADFDGAKTEGDVKGRLRVELAVEGLLLLYGTVRNAVSGVC